MSDATFFLSKSSVQYYKRNAAQLVTGVSSSHLSEAIAAAFGFNTNAALLAAFNGKKTLETEKPSNAKLNQRLIQFGYPAPPNLRLVPELDHSYTPFRSLALRKNKGVRWWGWRNLMVAAINDGLAKNLFGPAPGENWWPGVEKIDHQGYGNSYSYSFEIEGLGSARVNVYGISRDELSIAVALNPVNPEVEPSLFLGLEDGQAIAAGWFERRLGAWIQDGGEDFRCKRLILPRLAALNIQPLGYADQGSFFL